jgi:hypothetical protein
MAGTNKLHSDMFQSRYGATLTSGTKGAKSGTDLSLLPPCNTSLLLHCKRANYQTFIWKNAHVQNPSLPSPCGNGWTFDDSGTLQIQWTGIDIIPNSITDFLANSDWFMTEQEVEEDDVFDNILDIIFEEEEDCDE